jgi:ArsR family transcriptional regulator
MDDLIRPECEHRFVDPAPLPRDEMAEIAKALGHANRLCIIEQFFDGRAHTAGEIVSACDVAQSTTSEHLRILRDAGVLRSSRDGPHVWYCLDRGLLARFARSVAYLTADTGILTSLR